MSHSPTIFVVDDDPGVSRALSSVGSLLGLPVRAFSSGPEFLSAYQPHEPGCLVLDIKMPGMTGLEVQQQIISRGWHLPIIMISAHAGVRTAVEAMQCGAMTLLEKPFLLDEVIAHIRLALERDASRRERVARHADSAAKLAQLTEKDREVLELLVTGKSNKQIAGALHLSVRAVEDRRARLMKKLEVGSLAELVQLQLTQQT